MTKRNAQLRIGTSGYQYDHWRDVLYPSDLPKRDWFGHYARHFDTTEINNTFYNLPSAGTFDSWRAQAPPGFRFALKFSRYGTHMKKLKDPERTIGQFLERAERLKSFLGPVLVQLPPKWKADVARLDAFLSAAPRRVRWAVEFRDPTWLCDDVYQALKRHNAALCIHDMIDDHPWETPADWVYLRFHGTSETGRYAGQYAPRTLKNRAAKINGLLGRGRDVYAYFNNDLDGHAVRNAKQLREYAAR